MLPRPSPSAWHVSATTSPRPELPSAPLAESTECGRRLRRGEPRSRSFTALPSPVRLSRSVPSWFPADSRPTESGFGHCVFMVADAEEADRFVVEGLGMRQTDWIELTIAPGVVARGPLLPLQSSSPHAGADRSARTSAREEDASRDVRDRSSATMSAPRSTGRSSPATRSPMGSANTTTTRCSASTR